MESFWIHIAMVLFCHISVIMKRPITQPKQLSEPKSVCVHNAFFFGSIAGGFDYSKPLWKLPNRVVCCRRANPLRFLLISIMIRLIRIDTQGRGGNIFQQQPKNSSATLDQQRVGGEDFFWSIHLSFCLLSAQRLEEQARNIYFLSQLFVKVLECN